MFDDPGKKLRTIKDELLSVEEENGENFAVDFDDNAYDDEEFDEGSAVLAEERRGGKGGATLLLLLFFALGVYAAARWWLGWI